jgi:carboxyl-terminal processing protease
VQAVNYSHNNKPNSSPPPRTFKTAGGRPVYDAGGIAPDIALPRTKYSALLQALVEKDVIYGFANRYYAARPADVNASAFALSDAEYQEFVSYTKTLNFSYQTLEEQRFNDFEKALSAAYDSVPSSFRVAEIKEMLQQHRFNDLLVRRSEIQPFIEQEIVSRYAFQWGRIQTMIKSDREVEEAVKLLQDSVLYNGKLNLNYN